MAQRFPATESGMMMTRGYEGFEELPYYDTSEKPKLTAGYGFNLDDASIQKLLPPGYLDAVRGDVSKSPVMTKEMAEPIFQQIYNNSINDAVNYVGEDVFSKLSEGQRNVLIDMAYNLGAEKLGGFVDTRAALQAGDFPKAAEEMKDSLWYKQVGDRSKNHINQILR